MNNNVKLVFSDVVLDKVKKTAHLSLLCPLQVCTILFWKF